MAFTRMIALANKGVTVLGAAALGALPLIVFYDVTARYLFNAPTIWATDISIYIQQLLVFLPMGLLLSDDDHIRSTLVTDLLGPRAQHVLSLVTLVLVVVLAAFITWLGWSQTVHAWKQQQVSASLLPVPLWIPYAMLPLGGLLLLLSALGRLAQPAPARHATS